MPRVTFYGYPVRGHTAPSLPVVAELVRRGVEVDYYSATPFQALIEGVGARFYAYPDDCVALLTTPVDASQHLANSLAATEAMLPALIAALDPACALVLFDASALWGGILARHIAVPSVASITTFAFNRTMLKMLNAPAPDGSAMATLDRLNDQYGAGFQDHLDLMLPVANLKLVYTARNFQPAGRFFDEAHLFVGPLLGERPRDGRRAHKHGSRPLAYVSLGTLFNSDHAFLRRISEVLAARGWQVIVSLGNAAATQQVDDWPNHVEAHAFVDQIGVLAQAQLFVTHGGMNSVSEALAQAVPMIVIPQAVDQHLIARQTANLGAALAIDSGDAAIEGLTLALARMEDERETFQAAAARLQRGFADIVPLPSAIDQALGLLEKDEGHA